MPPGWIRNTISVGERSQPYAYRAATGTGDEPNQAEEFLETAGETYAQTRG